MSMGRFAFAVLLAALPVRAQGISPSTKPLNIVIIDICSARADHFGSYGYPKPTTPGMDAIAKDATVFERAVAQASWCMGNYASLFTGQGPEVHGLYVMARRKLPEGLPTLAEQLKLAGYDTAAYSGGGTWLLPGWGMDRGFDEYVDVVSTSNPDALTPLNERAPRMLDWVRARGNPFFLYVSVEDLHLEDESEAGEIVWNIPPDDEEGHVALSPDATRVSLLRTPEGKPKKSVLPPPLHKRLGWTPQPHLVEQYDRSLAYTDRSVSQFLKKIQELGRWDDTLVIIAGDHGDQLGEHGLVGHMTGLYEPILHVPLILRHPGFPELKGKRIGRLVERVDLMPTLLDVAGRPYKDLNLPGRSLLDLLRNPERPWRKYAFASSKRHGDGKTTAGRIATDLILDERTVRTEKWKLHWYLHKNRYELYDLENDPREERDLSEKRPDIVAELAFQLIKNLELSRPHAPGLPSGNDASGLQVAPRKD
ncbi:MAG TPA: hypothetical protein DCM05_04205 [Elusimicrobia bacterium]|nr:hypothetical protein [Elusimicrobiota bacterium]